MAGPASYVPRVQLYSVLSTVVIRLSVIYAVRTQLQGCVSSTVRRGRVSSDARKPCGAFIQLLRLRALRHGTCTALLLENQLHARTNTRTTPHTRRPTPHTRRPTARTALVPNNLLEGEWPLLALPAHSPEDGGLCAEDVGGRVCPRALAPARRCPRIAPRSPGRAPSRAGSSEPVLSN